MLLGLLRRNHLHMRLIPDPLQLETEHRMFIMGAQRRNGLRNLSIARCSVQAQEQLVALEWDTTIKVRRQIRMEIVV